LAPAEPEANLKPVRLLLIALVGLSLAALKADEQRNPASGAAARSSESSTANQETEKQYQQVLLDDNAAQEEADRWVLENSRLKAKGEGVSQEELEARISERFKPVRQAYERFTSQHPDDARARLAYGNFLNARHDEAGAEVQWEKALELDPKNAAVYNNLACRYSETGPVKKAFEYFERALLLAPSEAAHYHNFGDTVYVLRKSAMEHYGLTEQQIFEKALLLYSNAVRLQPQNFAYGWDFAQTYYAIKPLPTEPALVAWTNTLQAAHNEIERESIYLHFARIKMLAGKLAEARGQLKIVTNDAHLELKTRLLSRIEAEEGAAAKQR
jgi:tetratricopeptide (TPR) repeat protein